MKNKWIIDTSPGSGAATLAHHGARSIPPYLCMLILLWGVSCQKNNSRSTAPTPPANAVAQVGDAIISLDEFQAALNHRSRGNHGRFASLEVKQSLLREMIQTEVLYQRAKAEGYDSNPEIVAALKRMMSHKFQEDHVVDLMDSSVSEEEIQSYYQKHADEFATPEQRLGAVIFISTPPQDTVRKSQIENKAKEILKEALEQGNQESAGPGFGALAAKHSEDQATRYRGGEMGWLRNQPHARWEAPVVTALYALEHPGQISPIVSTAKGFYLVKLVDAKPEALRPLEKVREGIRYKIEREKAQQAKEDFIAAQSAQVETIINRDLLESIQARNDLAPQGPPGTPGTPGT